MKKSMNPNSQYLQKIRARNEKEERLQQLQLTQRERVNKREQRLANATSDPTNVGRMPEVDMKEIVRKALLMRLGKPHDLIYLQHLSPLRMNKNRN